MAALSLLHCMRTQQPSRAEGRHVVLQVACGQPHVLAARFLQLEGDVRAHIDCLQPSLSCTGAPDVLSASLTCSTGSADRATRHMCRSTEASAHHWLAHSDARHVAEVGDTPNAMIVQWLELNRGCAQPPALHAHTAVLEG